MSKNGPKPTKHTIVVTYDESTGNVEFSFSSMDAIRNLGMLELAKEQIQQGYRRANMPAVMVPNVLDIPKVKS